MNTVAHQLTNRLANLPWLDNAAETLKKIGEPILGAKGPQEIKDVLYGTWLGHPLHPAMTDIPIGCWTASLLLDAAGMERGADLTLKAGTIGALGAAATGMAQWHDLQEMDEPRRLGALHATLNIAATGLYATSWLLRSAQLRSAGVATALCGYGLAATSAMIGGDLSFRLGIGVSRVAFEEPSSRWREASSLAELHDGELKRVEVKGVPLILLRDGDQVFAASATCTHVGAPLDEGEVEERCVTCPWHGSVFDLTNGQVVHGPATAALHVFETQVVDGKVQVRPRQAG